VQNSRVGCWIVQLPITKYRHVTREEIQVDLTVIYFMGMIGALAPEIVRLYSIRNDPAKFQWSWFYLLISVLFACLGGILALALPATTYWGALYIGISTPVLVNTLVKKSQELTKPRLKARPENIRRYSVVDSFIYGL
jgi:hypothetical protein